MFWAAGFADGHFALFDPKPLYVATNAGLYFVAV
jgi:hypothetical protein